MGKGIIEFSTARDSHCDKKHVFSIFTWHPSGCFASLQRSPTTKIWRSCLFRCASFSSSYSAGSPYLRHHRMLLYEYFHNFSPHPKYHPKVMEICQIREIVASWIVRPSSFPAVVLVCSFVSRLRTLEVPLEQMILRCDQNVGL